jgi:predicted transcriptional regulator
MKMKIQSMQDLKKEMLSVARGERKAAADAAQISFESVEAVIRLLTPENRFLLATIDQKKPTSVADLAKLVQRAEPKGNQ